MGKGWQGLLVKAFGGRDHLVTIESVEHVTPAYLRIRVNSETLFGKITWAPGEWLRFWVPDPLDPEQIYQRCYTIARRHGESTAFDIEIALHDAVGPGIDWARDAQAGDQLAVTPLGSKPFHTQPNRKGILLIGDSSSLSTVNAIIAHAPESMPIELFLEHQHDTEREFPLSTPPHVNLHRVLRADANSLASAIGETDWSGWQIWANGESASLTAVRKLFKRTSTIAKTDIHIQAYWIEGKSMGSARKAGSQES